jgi:hypothetical protein
MSVSDGQTANAATFNSAFVSKTSDSTVTGTITLDNGDSDTLVDAQLAINTVMDDLDIAEGLITTLQNDLDAAELIIAGLSAGGAGGGTKTDWSEQANAPVKQILGNIPVYTFSAGLDQQLYAVINVPSGYVAGDQITMKIKAFSEDTSGDFLLQTTAVLVRSETDEYDDTTNTHVSTNTAITMSAANDREPQKITLDLSEPDGEINAVALAAEHMLVVRFYRGTDTATGDVHFIIGSEEVLFS